MGIPIGGPPASAPCTLLGAFVAKAGSRVGTEFLRTTQPCHAAGTGSADTRSSSDRPNRPIITPRPANAQRVIQYGQSTASLKLTCDPSALPSGFITMITHEAGKPIVRMDFTAARIVRNVWRSPSKPALETHSIVER